MDEASTLTSNYQQLNVTKVHLDHLSAATCTMSACHMSTCQNGEDPDARNNFPLAAVKTRADGYFANIEIGLGKFGTPERLYRRKH